jgi:hypothetical protein
MTVDKGNRLPLNQHPMNTSKAASILGRKGGKTRGPVKARNPSHYSAISRAYWAAKKRRAFLVTFLSLSPEDKSRLFAAHGLHGANQTALHLWANQ